MLWWLYRARQLQLWSPLLSCPIVFFSSLVRSRHLSLFLLSLSFTLRSAGAIKSTIRQVLFCCCCCCWLWLGLVTWLRIDDPFVFNWNHFEMRLLNLRINFYLLRTFCSHLGSFWVVSSFTTFRPNFTTERRNNNISKWFQLKTITKFGTDPTMEDQIRRTNNWIYKTNYPSLIALRGPLRSG